MSRALLAYGGRFLLPRIRQHNICFIHLWYKTGLAKHTSTFCWLGMLSFTSGFSRLMQPRETKLTL